MFGFAYSFAIPGVGTPSVSSQTTVCSISHVPVDDECQYNIIIRDLNLTGAIQANTTRNNNYMHLNCKHGQSSSGARRLSTLHVQFSRH